MSTQMTQRSRKLIRKWLLQSCLCRTTQYKIFEEAIERAEKEAQEKGLASGQSKTMHKKMALHPGRHRSIR